MEITNQLSTNNNNAITSAQSPESSLAAIGVGSVVSLRQQQQKNVLREVEEMSQNNRRISGNFQQISEELQAKCTLLERELAATKHQNRVAEEDHQGQMRAIIDRFETLQKEMIAEREARIALEGRVNDLTTKLKSHNHLLGFTEGPWKNHFTTRPTNI